MRRSILLALTLTLVWAAPAAADPPPWTRWVVPANLDVSATVRSLDFTGPGIVYAGTEDDGIFASTNGGTTWAADNGGLDAPGAKNVRQVVSNSGSLYAATSLGLFRKAVGGGSWAPLGQGPGTDRLGLPVQYVHFNSSSDIVAGVAAASPGVYRSVDGGEHWSRSSGIPTGTSIYFLYSTGGMLFAAGDGGVFRSTDGGGSWSAASDGLPFANSYRMAGDPAHLYVATTSGVYHSDNLGVTWTERNGHANGALGNTQTLGMLAAPTGFGGGRFLVATGQGVWASLDHGLSWGKMASTSVPANPPFGTLKVWTLGLNPVAAPGRMLAGTQGQGAYSQPFQPPTATSPAAANGSGGGTVRVNHTLTGTPGGFAGTAPLVFAYMWMRCTDNSDTNTCSETGDTDLTHLVTLADKDLYLRLRVRATGLVPPQSPARFSGATQKVLAAQGSAPSLTGGSSVRILGPDNANAFGKSYDWGTQLHVDEGTWDTPPSFAYQWIRCIGSSANCAPIQGAVNETYNTVPADADNTLKVDVTATANNNSRTVTGGPTWTITERKPELVQAPRILGEAYVGTTLDSAGGAWRGRNITYFRTWQVCDSDGTGCNTIPSETDQRYTVNRIYLGKRLRLRIQVSNAAGSQDDREAFSDLTPVITERPVDGPPAGGGDPPGGGGGGGANPPVGGNPPVLNPPVVNPPVGRPSLIRPRKLRVGAVLKAPSIPGATRVRYQWLRNGKPIKKARKRSYRIKRADRGKRISCRMSFVLGGRPLKVTTKALKIPRKRR